MLLTNKKIAIVGGGPGGLTLARLLQLKGVEVKVYERDVNEEARVQGATLDLHFESGLRAIRAAGLLEVFEKTYRPGAEKGRVIDKHGRILFDEHGTATKDFNDAACRPEIDRSDLRNILLDSLLPGTVVWNSQFLNMTKDGNSWKLEFKNGTTAVADLVMGADGANSRIRPFVTSTKPTYAGVVILQGNVPDAANTIPAMHHLLNGGKIYVHDDGKFLHVSSKGDGSIDFYISCKKEAAWWNTNGIDFSDRNQVSLWFKDEFPDWDAIWFTLIENTSLPLLIRPQYCMPLDDTWKALPDLSLLGDAAHSMPPSGEGVNLAMLDALELSECLTSDEFNDTRSAIEMYENEMRARAVAEAVVSLEMVEWMHGEGAMEKLMQLFNKG